MSAPGEGKAQPSRAQKWQPEDVRLYWRRLFPAELLLELFGASRNREFAMDIGDVHLRFVQCADASEMRKALSGKSVETAATSAHLGAVYSAPVERKGMNSGQAVACELRFDIDLSDYDELRSLMCGCKEKLMCGDCFSLAGMGLQILMEYLESRFGYKLFLPVFSGRRGMHLFVFDEAAYTLTSEMRSALLANLTLRREAGALKAKGEFWWANVRAAREANLSDKLRASMRDLFFRLFVQKYPLMETRRAELLRDFPETVKLHVESSKGTGSVSKWNALNLSLLRHSLTSPSEGLLLRRTFDRLLLSTLWPRCDQKVTTQLGHLIKLPFVVNPNTGLIGLPLSPQKISQFDPALCPGIEEAMAFLNDKDKKAPNPLAEAMLVVKDLTQKMKQQKPAAKHSSAQDTKL